MATPKTKSDEVVETVVDDRIEIFVPRGQENDEQTLLISVNGKNYFLPKGKKSLVKPEVAYEFRRSQAAQVMLDRNKQARLDASK